MFRHFLNAISLRKEKYFLDNSEAASSKRKKTALANRGSSTDLTGVGTIGRCDSMRVLSMVKYFSSSSTFRHKKNSQQGQNGEV